nr:hypothetical protein CFP56_22094 [Quercus suber]
MYDELAIVVGKDTATSGFSKSYVDIENEPDNGDSAEFVADNVEEDVVEKLKEIAMALKEINRGPVDYTSLYNEVMAMMADVYSEEMLATLCDNEKVAREFLAKNARLRKMWLDNFFFSQL